MRDDPTDENAADTLGAQLEAFRQEPEDADLFRELRATLKRAGQTSELAEIFELHAEGIGDGRRAVELWYEAGLLRQKLEESDLAERDFRRALDTDRSHDKAAARLADMLLAAGRLAEAADVIEDELEALEERDKNDGSNDALNRHRAARHRQLARLWDHELARIDRALHHWQRAFHLDPKDSEALEASRTIYASLGDDKMLVKLYEAELKVLGNSGDRERRARLELEVGKLKSKRGDTAQAAQHMETALRLTPDSLDAQEALAEVYAAAALSGQEQHQQRAGELFVALGRRRLAAGETDAAVTYLRRALGVDPYSRSGTDKLEGALRESERWDELDRFYRHRLTVSESANEQVTILARRAELFENYLEDRDELKALLTALATTPGGHAEYSRRLRALYYEDGDWKKLVELIESELATDEPSPGRAARELLELATIYRENLNDKDKAAECLHRVLSIDPQNEEALARYGDHFRERRDWRGLADLHEFTLDQLSARGADRSEIIRLLEELAQLCELRLGDIDRAITTWRRIEQTDPGNPKAVEALRRLVSRAKMWESLVGVLEKEADAAQSPDTRAEALRRIAQVYRERQVNPRRAIALYEEVLKLFPDDEGVLKALSELYEREGDDAGLAHTIRRQLDLELRKLLAATEISGERPASAREWPVAKRVERLTALRRLASMYEQRLADVDGVVFACSGILEILPGDRDALERMERVLDKSGDHARLEQTLEYHAAASTAPAERAKIMRQLAHIAAERTDDMIALERWEQVLRTAPNDSEALEALSVLYDRHNRWGELAEVLERLLSTAEAPEPGTAAAAQYAAQLKRYAAVVDERLDDAARSVRAWQRVLKVSSRDRDALGALVRLHEKSGQWRDLAEVLERLAPMCLESEPERAAELALRRAKLLEERLGAPAEAEKALEHLIEHIDPANLAAHKVLRRLRETRGDFAGAIRVAEREMFLCTDPQEKVARGLEIGLMSRDRLDAPMRALHALERVLAIDSEHEEALAAAAELYASVGDWDRHIELLERRVARASDDRERRSILLRIASAAASHLSDHRAAFEWYRKAHEVAPDSTTMAELRRAAEAFGLWRELAEVYDNELASLREGDDVPDRMSYVATCRELAALCDRRLKDPRRAMAAIRDALSVQPEGEDLLTEAERIASDAKSRALWQELVDCFELPLGSASRDERIELHMRRAQILEDQLSDTQRAMTELLRAFSWNPDRADVQGAIHELGQRTSQWSPVVSMETALIERAGSAAAQIGRLRGLAQLFEEQIENLPRAFRTHLSAFLLAPEDSDTTQHLWRIARLIGEYEPAERSPAKEPEAAHIEPPPSIISAGPGKPPIRIEARTAAREATQELSVTDLVTFSDGIGGIDTDENHELPTIEDGEPATRREDITQPLDISELMDVEGKSRADPTMELRTEDLIEALGVKARPAPAAPPAASSSAEHRIGGPPPPPPKRPSIRRAPPGLPPTAHNRPASPRSSQQTARRPIPSMPARSYDTPWAELAAAYSTIRSGDPATQLRWLFRAAEVWETGARDIPRAFDALSRALESAPRNPEARDRLRRLAADHGEWDRLVGLYEAAANEARSAEAAADLLMEVASIREEQGRPRETESLYRRVLGMRPEDLVARERLEALYRKESRWIDLAASLEERTDPRLGSAAPVAERPALLRELATIYREKLNRPHDAIDALERLRELSPEDLDILQQLAELNGAVERWSKVIEILTRVADIADGTEGARTALGQIGQIYEHELELPDRAIDAYSQLLAQWPQDTRAFEALDALYQQFGRWKDLEEILRQRGAVSRDPAERAQVLGRRAGILLEWLDSPEEAVSALRHARTIAPDDPDLSDSLVTALIRSGRQREAASVLEGRIGALRDRDDASAGDIAAVLVRLAGLRAEELRDPHGARALLEEALELVPDHPTALTTLAKLAKVEKDPRAYADARLREAEHMKDIDSKVEALLDAGEALSECNDVDRARETYERVLELRPYHSTATWALASLIEGSGDLEEAIRLLEARLEAASLDVTERAQVLTQLAALSHRAGISAAAERRLQEALQVMPSHLPAIYSLADLLAESTRWPDLEIFLDRVIATLDDAAPETRAELLRRRAVASEALDRPDDAYQTLIEADRCHRGNLMVKLALGENRYRARRWREAALHLASLAEHPLADRHPAEVAEGLYHAALAEIRSLRPEKAEALYERALELKGNFAPALHALAELAMEKGDTRRAADLLTRQAMASQDPAERLRLFEALGDMSMLTLEDPARAAVCYEAAVNAASPLESKHVPLLEKLLEQQERQQDDLGAGKTSELMASFAKTPEERVSLLVAASAFYRRADHDDRARLAAERAVEASPYDLTAVTAASELTMESGDFESTAAMLGRALSSDKGDFDEISGPRKALLWSRLAQARRQRGDIKGTVSACEKALDSSPDSDGAMQARRILIPLWADSAERQTTLLDFRRVLAADTLESDDVLGYARALCARGDGDGGRVTLELAAALGHEYSDEDVAFLGANPAVVMAEDEAYAGVLGRDAREELLTSSATTRLASLCTTLWEAAPYLWADVDTALLDAGLTGATRVTATSAISAATVFTRIARALDAPATMLFATDQPGTPDVSILCVTPPTIVLGHRLVAASAEPPPDLELRFKLARVAELARPEYIIAAGLPAGQFAQLLAALVRIFGDTASAGKSDDGAGHDDEALRKALPVKVRAKLEKLLATAGELGPERYLAACNRMADRAGLLICGDLDTARRLSSDVDPNGNANTRHLDELVLMKGYLAARRQLGVGANREKRRD